MENMKFRIFRLNAAHNPHTEGAFPGDELKNYSLEETDTEAVDTVEDALNLLDNLTPFKHYVILPVVYNRR